MTELATTEQPAEIMVRPVPLSHGSYALYPTPSGGLHLVYRVKGSDQDGHMEIPAFVVETAAKMAGDEDLGPLAVLLGRAPE
jgi:hypothetical protein